MTSAGLKLSGRGPPASPMILMTPSGFVERSSCVVVVADATGVLKNVHASATENAARVVLVLLCIVLYGFPLREPTRKFSIADTLWKCLLDEAF